ncbi:MAG: hypothetical protein N2035_09425 [Chthoniobacterales bacterium]|nr:hypothetical protein [Chthoniobacterales bacterium]
MAMKSVMFPYPLGMLGICSVLYLAQHLEKARNLTRNGLFRGVWFLAIVWFVVVLPTVPHFVFHARAVLGYIKNVAFESEFYRLQEAHGPQWLFHWLGYSGV